MVQPALTITQAQMELLAEKARLRFEDRMVAHVAAEYPGRFAKLRPEGTRALVRAVIARGAACNVSTEGAVAALIELWVAFGPEFERSPHQADALELLEHPTMPAGLKLSLIQELLTALSGGRAIVPVDED